MITFKEFMNRKEELVETGTTTADVAGFSRITIPLVRRMWADWYNKKKGYQQPQVKESKKN